MKIVCVGGGPAGLYLAILMKKADPSHQITVLERNPPDVTFGWGVVFSDETMSYLQDNDAESYEEITRTFAHWDAIDTHYQGEVIRSRGHGFSGIARRHLLGILQRRAAALGVELRYGVEVDDVRALARTCDLLVGADGLRSKVRAAWEDVFQPELDVRACRYIWLGTHQRFDAFKFFFEHNEHGVFQVHAYRFDAEASTFIVECDEASWRAAGLDAMSVEQGVAYCETLFAKHLGGHKLLTNNSSWINFTTVRNRVWHHANVVLLGDAAHTAHFSIGSGTKLALEDSIALARAFRGGGALPEVLARYEADRRPIVERTQKAAQDSLSWFEHVKRYYGRQSPLQFTFNLLTRSKKISYENLKLRDPEFVARVTAEYARTQARAAVGSEQRVVGATGAHTGAASPRVVGATGAHTGAAPPYPPPMFTPFTLREMRLENRVVVSPMCMYSAEDGTPNDFHLVHLGARAQGGAGLIVTEMTDVSADARISPGCTGMYKPEHVPAWRRIVDFVHARTRAKIALQLGHAGRKGSTRVMWEGMDEPLPSGNWPLIAPSPLPYLPHSQVPRAMDRADMDRVRDDFVRATRMAEQAGFDMIELHMAHGYLLSSFISPLTNVRRDEYGGSTENRMRFPLEVFAAMRAAWPAHKPMSVRISATDWHEGGLEGDEAVEIARMLKAHGVDIVDVSTGQTVKDAKPVFGRMWQTPFSDQIRHGAGVPTMTVGNISSADQVNSILGAGRADLCVLARPHLGDPFWTLHAAAQQGYDGVEWPVQYAPGKPLPPAPR